MNAIVFVVALFSALALGHPRIDSMRGADEAECDKLTARFKVTGFNVQRDGNTKVVRTKSPHPGVVDPNPKSGHFITPPWLVYASVAKAIGSDPGLLPPRVSCDLPKLPTLEFVFENQKASGGEGKLRLEPKDYVDTANPDEDGLCIAYFLVGIMENRYVFPSTYKQRICESLRQK